MSSPTSTLAEICKATSILDLETGTVWEYSKLDVEPSWVHYHIQNPPTCHYLLFWPFGIFAYVATHFKLTELQPSFIEAAHKSAKKLRPFSPPIARRWR